jgi:hypothetical protein
MESSLLQKPPACSLCQTKEESELGRERKYYVSIRCAHLLCSMCLDNTFDTQTSAQCMEADCGSHLYRDDYEPRTEDEKMVNKEVLNRRDLARIYNLTRMEFGAIHCDPSGEVGTVTGFAAGRRHPGV